MLHEVPATDRTLHGPITFDRILVLEISAAAQTDPRTTRKELRDPGSVKGIAGDKIRRELRARGVR
jgi:hypothetical protein